MEDPPPSATWHPALRPETLNEIDLYSPELNGPRAVSLSWDGVTPRTPIRSRGPTNSMVHSMPTTTSITEEELGILQVVGELSESRPVAFIKMAQRESAIAMTETLEEPRNFYSHSFLSNLDSEGLESATMQSTDDSTSPTTHTGSKKKEATKDIVPDRLSQERDSPLTLFPTNERGSSGDEIDAAWGNIETADYTNNFPTVPAPSLAQLSIQSLPHSQAASIITEGQAPVLGIRRDELIIGYPWDDTRDHFAHDGDFFSKSESLVQPPLTSPDDEARFEEGIPLISQSNAYQIDGSQNIGRDLVFGKDSIPAEDDFFSGLDPPHVSPEAQSGTLTRKSTGQVIDSMHIFSNSVPSAEDVKPPDHISSTPASSSIIPSAAAGSTSNYIFSAEKNDTLAAMWEEALGGDLLDDAVDPSSFFGEEDDGFLLEDGTSSVPQPNPTAQPNDSIQQPPQNYTNPNAASYVPARFDSTAYQRSQSFFQTQPTQPAIITRAQSFADKSKGGYESPYDAPMDLIRPRKAQSSRTSQVLPRVDSAPPPQQPPRGDSLQSAYVRAPTPSQLSPSASSHNSSSNNYQAASSSPQLHQALQRPPSRGFFEELPITAKSRSSAALARFTSQYPQQQFVLPPSSNNPQQYASQQPPPRVSSQFSSPPPNSFGLVAPTKVIPFSRIPESAPRPSATPPAPPSTVGRYSPTNSQRLDQQQPSPQDFHTIPPNPYANSTGIKRPPSVPHHHTPNRPSPLARSSSANHYRSGDELSSAPVIDNRQVLGMRSPSRLRNTQNSDETQSPRFQAPLNALGIISSDYSPEVNQNRSAYEHDATSSHESSRQPSQSSAHQEAHTHQEAQTPRTAVIQPQASIRTYVKNIETYSISQQAILSSTNRVRAPSLIGHDNFIPPSDATAQDPLKRWQGAPIFRFGFGGTVIASFPGRIPRYTQGSRIPFIKSSPREVRIISAKILPSNDRIASFPGPLKSKGKKKEVLLWLYTGIASLSQEQIELHGQGTTTEDPKRHQEKIMLWKVLTTLVEHDGNIDGNVQALDAVRTILSPEANSHESRDTLIQPRLPAISSPDTAFRPQATGSSAVDTLRQYLLNGEREKAVWYAVDQKLWGHAMLIASTMQRDLWKQILHEFVGTEVKPAGRNTESLAALYDVFAGNWEESVDKLVPPSARAGLTLMNKNSTGVITGNGLDGLNRWRETLHLILSNRTADDSKAIVAMGQLLASYGRFEAAHICYIFAKAPGLFGGFDDPQTAVILLGADHRQLPLNYAKDPDSILLTEVFEFIQSVLISTPSQSITLPYLQAFKLYHAELLVELGLKEEAQQYCDVLTSTLKATTNRSPYFHSRLFSAVDELGARLRELGKDGNSSWISRPNVDKMSGSFFKALSGFIAGDENDASAASAKADAEGPFARINGTTPEMISRNSSPVAVGYGDFAAGQTYAPPNPSMHPTTNSRYAPVSTSSTYAPLAAGIPRYSSPLNSGHQINSGLPSSPYEAHHPQQIVHAPLQATQALSPLWNVTKYSPDLTSQPQVFPHPPAEHVEAPRSYSDTDAGSSPRGNTNEAPALNGFLSTNSRADAYQAAPPPSNVRYSPSASYAPRSRSLEPSSSSYEIMSTASQPRSYAPSPNLHSLTPYEVDSYQPNAPMYGEFPMAASQNLHGNDKPASTNIPNTAHEMNNSVDSMINQSLDTATPITRINASIYRESESAAEYQPPSYGYEPPTYDTEVAGESDVRSPRKKQSFMDLDEDEDDLGRRAAALKKSQKSTTDRETDDAFRRAAEEDAKKTAVSKSGSGWLSGIWGRSGSKDQNQAKPKAHQIHIGEENSFVFDKDLNKWVNKKAGGESTAPSAAKAPPPKGPPKAVVGGPSFGIRSPISNSINETTSESLSGIGTPGQGLLPSSMPPAGLTLGLAPPSRPGTGMSVVSNDSSVDDLMGPAQPRKGGTMKRSKKRAGYIDVLAEKT